MNLSRRTVSSIALLHVLAWSAGADAAPATPSEPAPEAPPPGTEAAEPEDAPTAEPRKPSATRRPNGAKPAGQPGATTDGSGTGTAALGPSGPSASASAEGESPTAAEPPPAADSAATGATADARKGAERGAPAPSERYSPRDPTPSKTRWIHRYPPQAMTGEVGIFAGVWFPGRHLELYEPNPSLPRSGHQRLATAAADLGLRGGFYPLRFLGVEIEAAIMPTRTRSTDARATAWALRGHVIGQLPFWSITPFLLVGTGVIGIAGADPPESLGEDQDVAIHFGGGAKFQINEWVQLRLDVRNVVSNQRGVGEGLTSSPEILGGLSVTLGRRKERPATSRPEDRDGDGIEDADDYCPDVYGEPPRGCPQVCIDDSDGDGLTDPVDACPTVPETRNGYEDDDGCPDEVPPDLSSLSGIMVGIQFDTDKDTIKNESQGTIDQAVAVMQKYPDLRVEVGGHTDSRGSYRHNMDLSRRRAEAVKNYMVQAGIAEDRIETRGYGPDQPIASNETREGQAQNRRIEFKILVDTAGVSTTPAPPVDSSDAP